MLSVVLPVYNEAANLPELFRRINAAAAEWFCDFEVLVVDDGSQDGSAELVRQFHRRDPRWRLLSFSRNFGHQAAVSAGLHYSRGEATVVLDADLQDPPELIHAFLEQWREGFHVVYGVRARRREFWLKRLAYAAFYRGLQRVSTLALPLDAGDFCLLDRTVVDVLCAMPERSRYVRGLRAWAGFRQTGVPYDRPLRNAGKSKYSLAGLIRLASDGLVSFSAAPLRLASWGGVTLCLTALLLLAAICGWSLSGVRLLGMHPRDALGWTSLCALILGLSGGQMLLIGVLGEYLAHTFEEVKGRPPWVIADALGVVAPKERPPLGWFAGRPGGARTVVRRGA